MEKIIQDLINNGSRKEINYVEKIISDHYVEFLRRQSQEIEVCILNSKQHLFSNVGLCGYQGKTVLEIKLYKLSNGMYKFTEQELSGRSSRIESLISSKDGLENLIYVINPNVYESIITIENRINKLKERYNDVNLIIVSLEDFFNIVGLQKDKIIESLENLNDNVFKIEINDAVNEKVKSQNNRNDKLIDELNQKFKSDKLVLFLGAGASKDAGMPLWNELLSDMFVSYLEKPINVSEKKILFSEAEKKRFVDYFIQSNDGAPTLQSMYIKTMGKDKFADKTDNERMRDLLHSVLYRNPIKESKLIKEVVELCRPTRSRKGLHAIINYNFDDLVEQNIEKNNIVTCKAITRDFEKLDEDDLPIYHVHGYVPKVLNGNIESMNDHLVFTQDEYHKIYNEHYHWANLIQLNQLKERTCIFVGMSMTDPNLRRMLDLAKEIDEDETIKKHYAILQRDRLDRSKEKNVRKVHIEAFENSNQRVRELYFEGLGVNVIWYDDHAEVPLILERIRVSNNKR